MKRVALLLLAALMLILAACAAPAEETPAARAEDGVLHLNDQAGNTLGVVTLEQIRALDSYKRTVEIHSSGEGDSVHEFRGARLRDIIYLVDPTLLETYDYVTAVGTDDYLAAISMDEVQMENNAFVMYEDNDAALTTKSGEECGMRLVMLDDTFGMRFTRYLVDITFLTQAEMEASYEDE